MGSDDQGRLDIHAERVALGVTGEGNVIFSVGFKVPPKEKGVLCHIDGCGTYRWPHAPACPGCGFDFTAKRLHRFQRTLTALLALAVVLIAVIAQRN